MTTTARTEIFIIADANGWTVEEEGHTALRMRRVTEAGSEHLFAGFSASGRMEGAVEIIDGESNTPIDVIDMARPARASLISRLRSTLIYQAPVARFIAVPSDQATRSGATAYVVRDTLTGEQGTLLQGREDAEYAARQMTYLSRPQVEWPTGRTHTAR